MPPSGDDVHWVRGAQVEPDYFQAFGARIVSGRDFAPGDAESGRRVAIVDQTFVREALGGRDPVGLRIRQAGVDRPQGLDRSAPGQIGRAHV